MPNIHATAVVLSDRGIVIRGESGTGKTQLALALICHAMAQGLFGRLVSDDQIILSIHGGRLACEAPATIAGLVEVRSVGPSRMDFIAKAPVDLLVDLDAGSAERFPELRTDLLLGCEVPAVRLWSGDRQAALAAVLARLSLPPFGGS